MATIVITVLVVLVAGVPTAPAGAIEGIPAQRSATPDDEIPDLSLTLGGGSHTLDVAGYFSDAVHSFDITVSPSGIARISRSGTEITIEPRAAGSATVTVRGRRVGGSERKRFTVTVSATISAPTASGSIEAATLTEGATHVVDASAYFEGEGLSYAAQSSESAVATVEVAGASVTVTPVAAGGATLTVTNTGGSAEQTFAVTVLPPAPAPLGSIDALTLTRGATHSVDASDYFEGKGLTYAAQSSDATVASVEVDGAAVTVTAVAAGSATLTVTAANAGGSAQQSFAVTVRLPAITLTGAGDERVIELSGHFGDAVTGYAVSVSPAGIVEASIAQTRLTLTAIAVGSATVSLEVTGADGSARHSFAVTVTPPAPLALGSIEDVTLAAHETHKVTASDHFEGEGVTYGASSSAPTVATVSVDGAAVTVKALAVGEATVTIAATNAGGSAEQRFRVTVELPRITLVEGGDALEIELANYFGDEVSSYEVLVVPSGVVHASRSGSVLTVTAVAVGDATLTVTATNGGGSAQQAFAVTVVAAAPTALGSIEGVTLTEGATRGVDASAYFEGEGLTYAAQSSDAAVASVELAGSSVTVTAVAAGEATLTVTATNGGGSAQQSFAVTVVAAAPTALGSIEGVMLTEGATHGVDASQHFEGEGLTYGAQSSDAAVASVGLAGSSVTVTAVAAGEATLTVTAANGGGSAQQSFAVTVLPPAPTATGSLEALTLTEGATHGVDASAYFEGEGLTYAAQSSDAAVASVELAGSSVTVTAVAAGEATLTVTATNAGGSAQQSFGVTVLPPAPASTGSIEAVTLSEGATHGVDASAYFEGEGLTYAAQSSDAAVASVAVAGSSVTVTAVAAGEATLTVTAANGGGSAQQSFGVEVRPRPPEVVGGIPEVTLREAGEAHTLDLADYVEGAVVGYEVSADPGGVVHLWESDGRLMLTPLASGVATVTAIAANEGGVAELAFLVTVRERAPRALGSAPLVTVTEDDYSILDATGYFEGAGISFEAESRDSGVAVAAMQGGALLIVGVSTGFTTVTVTATNGGGSAGRELLVFVSRRAPVALRQLGDLTLGAGAGGRSIDLAGYFSASFSRAGASASPGGIVHLWESDGRLTLRPLAAGTATVTVWVWNSGGSASQTLELTVRPQAPRALTGSALLALQEDDAPLTIDLANYFAGAITSYELAATPGGVVHPWESRGRLTLTPLAPGLTTLTVTALNEGGSAERTFSVVVQPRAPRALGRIVGASLTAGAAAQEIALGDYFGGSVAYYEVAAFPGGVLHLRESGGRLWLTPLAAGVATVTVTASNGSGSAAQAFAVAVGPAAPTVLGNVEGITLAEGGPALELDLADYLGGRALHYGFTVEPGGVVHLWESGGRLRLTPLAVGVATVRATATNTAGRIEQDFVVTVGPAAPVALRGIEHTTLVPGAALELELTDYFGGRVARYQVAADPAGVVHAWESGGRLTLTPLARGVATVEVIAVNDGGSTRLEFTVSVGALP